MARRNIEQIFDYGGPIFTLGSWIFDLFVLNSIWLLTSGVAACAVLFYLFGHTALSGVSPWLGYSLLVLAFLFWHPATTALYYTLSKKTRGYETYMLRDYFRSYRTNFKQSFCVGLLISFLAALTFYNHYLLTQFPNMFGSFTHMLLVMQIVIGAEILFFAIYSVAILARLQVKTKDLIRNSFGMANKHWLTTILCALVLVAAFLAVYYLSLALVLLIEAPAMLCVVSLMEKQVLRRYIPDEEDLGKKSLRADGSLGDEDDDDDNDDDEE